VTTTTEAPEETLDMIAAYVFQAGGAEMLRKLFAVPQFCWFRDEIIDIGDALKARGLGGAAKVMYEIAPSFPEFVYCNPHDRDDPNDRANWRWRESHPNGQSRRLEQRAKFCGHGEVGNG